jgi:hypothetical protein
LSAGRVDGPEPAKNASEKNDGRGIEKKSKRNIEKKYRKDIIGKKKKQTNNPISTINSL